MFGHHPSFHTPKPTPNPHLSHPWIEPQRQKEGGSCFHLSSLPFAHGVVSSHSLSFSPVLLSLVSEERETQGVSSRNLRFGEVDFVAGEASSASLVVVELIVAVVGVVAVAVAVVKGGWWGLCWSGLRWRKNMVKTGSLAY